MQGGMRPEIRFPDVETVPPLEENPTTSFELFRTAWRKTVEDPAFSDYARSRLPATLANVSDYVASFNISEEASGYAPFMYDAVTLLALSYCRAVNAASGAVGGAEVFAEFSKLDFNGGSGYVEIESETGTRNYTSVLFMLFNVQPMEVDDDGMQTYKLVPTKFYNNSWSSIEGRDYVYADGGNSTPPSLPPPQVENNYIGTTGRAVGYSLMGIVFLGSFAAFVWMLVYREERAVRSSQPLFLFMIAFGTMVMASSIVSLSMEEPVPESGLDAACMASPWLYVSGAVVAFSSLLAKTRGVRKVSLQPCAPSCASLFPGTELTPCNTGLHQPKPRFHSRHYLRHHGNIFCSVCRELYCVD